MREKVNIQKTKSKIFDYIKSDFIKNFNLKKMI